MVIRKKHWVALGIGAVGAAASIIVACSITGDGNVGTAHTGSKLELANVVFPGFVTDSGLHSNPGFAGMIANPTAAWDPMGNATGGVFVVGASAPLITQMCPTPGAGWCPGPPMMSWWSSATGNSVPPGLNYGNRCDTSIAGCAECSMTTLMPSTWVSTDVLMGDPYLASDGIGDVVYVGEVDTDQNPSDGAERIIALVSGDGGQHFDEAQWVNDDPGHSCNQGTQRMPHVTFDTTVTPPELWVVWGNKNASNFGGCIRHGRLLHSIRNVGGCNQVNFASINWLVNPDGNSSESVSNMKQACSGVGCSTGQGSLMVEAGDGAVTVMYSGNDGAPSAGPGELGCPGGNPFTTTMGWGTVTSNDYGHSWSTRSLDVPRAG